LIPKLCCYGDAELQRGSGVVGTEPKNYGGYLRLAEVEMDTVGKSMAVSIVTR